MTVRAARAGGGSCGSCGRGWEGWEVRDAPEPPKGDKLEKWLLFVLVRIKRGKTKRECLGGALKVSEGVGIMGGVGIMERLPQSQRVGAAGYMNTNWHEMGLYRVVGIRLSHEFSADGELFCEYIVICCWELKFCYMGLGLNNNYKI